MSDKPTHYKVVCHSMYIEDLAACDDKVAQLKALGWTGANRSHLIRIALEALSKGDLVSIADAQRSKR